MTTKWTLNKFEDRRIRGGHPWVFSNELSKSPKGHPPGEPVELRTHQGDFLAYGYGNPQSLISFRAMGFDIDKDEKWYEPQNMVAKLLKSWTLRHQLGVRFSQRICFGEVDGMPGLVVDLYVLNSNSGPAQSFSVQILTAGMSWALKDLEGFFKSLCDQGNQLGLTKIEWQRTALILRNDVQVRKLEGLEFEEPRVVKSIDGEDLSQNVKILVDSSDEGAEFEVHLLHGQKTGFFLDQSYNIQLLGQIAKRYFSHQKSRTLHILDLCCYVGQWSSQLSRILKNTGHQINVTAVDASETALEFANKNIRNQYSHQVTLIKGDVLKDLHLPEESFDIVISDPPAFIKNRKDLAAGKQGYVKLNSRAFRLAKVQGLIASCSCSGLLSEEDFLQALAAAQLKADVSTTTLARGGHGFDHPVKMTFPEGNYLKMAINLRT